MTEVIAADIDELTVREADDYDLLRLLEWLSDERRSTGEGFYCNAGVIIRAWRENELYALIQKFQPRRWHHFRVFEGLPTNESECEVVGFAVVGNKAIDIIEIHPAYRWKGYATVLLDQLDELGFHPGPEIEAVPGSVGFWERRGYQRVDAGSSGNVQMRLARRTGDLF